MLLLLAGLFWVPRTRRLALRSRRSPQRNGRTTRQQPDNAEAGTPRRQPSVAAADREVAMAGRLEPLPRPPANATPPTDGIDADDSARAACTTSELPTAAAAAATPPLLLAAALPRAGADATAAAVALNANAAGTAWTCFGCPLSRVVRATATATVLVAVVVVVVATDAGGPNCRRRAAQPRASA